MAGPILWKGPSFNTNLTDISAAGTSRTLEFSDKYLELEISKEITDLDPNRSLFLRMLELIGTKEPVRNAKFEWLEERLKTFKTNIAGGSAIIGSDVATALDVTDANLFKEGDILKIIKVSGANKRLFEQVRVTAIASTTQVTIVRGQGGTSARNDFLAADEVLRVGSAYQENTGAPTADFIEPTDVYNFCQTFKDAVELSGRMQQTAFVHGGSEETRQLQKQMLKHAEDINRAFLFGNRAHGSGITMTGGLEYFVRTYGALTDSSIGLSSNIFDMTTGTFSDTWFDKIGDIIFRFGSKEKVFLTSGKVRAKINTFAKDYLEVSKADSDALGVEVTNIRAGGGVLKLIQSRDFDESELYRDTAFIIDPTMVSKRPFTGRDTRLRKNIQGVDQDGVKHSIESDVGLQVKGAGLCHFIVNGLSTSIT